jgi:tRNA (cytidine/uridine-2'-O-)-methyltransferase
MRIALYEPDIPQNTGNVFRLGACLGLPVDIIEPAGFIIDDKRLKRASMDYYYYLDLTKHISWEKFYNWSIKNKYRLILLTTKSNKSCYQYIFRSNDIILFGRESAGVPQSVHDSVDERLKIPMVKGPRSINLSSSVAIVAGEMLRQLKLS